MFRLAPWGYRDMTRESDFPGAGGEAIIDVGCINAATAVSEPGRKDLLSSPTSGCCLAVVTGLHPKAAEWSLLLSFAAAYIIGHAAVNIPLITSWRSKRRSFVDANISRWLRLLTLLQCRFRD